MRKFNLSRIFLFLGILGSIVITSSCSKLSSGSSSYNSTTSVSEVPDISEPITSIIDSSGSSEESSENKTQLQGMQYDLYILAVQSGYDGTYEEWLDSIRGENGKSVEIRYDNQSGWVQWKYTDEDDSEWRNLISLADLVGAQGPQGETGATGATGAPMGYGAERFLDTIPYAIDEAGTIDGANKLQIFIHITLPLAKPMIVYTSLASFTWLWSDFILPKLLLKQKNLYTVAVGLMSLGEDEFARFAAGS